MSPPLPEDLVLGPIRQMIVVGMIAPSVFVGTMAVHLAGHPDLQVQLRADLTLVPAAVGEYLRLFTPYRGVARTALQDFGPRSGHHFCDRRTPSAWTETSR